MPVTWPGVPPVRLMGDLGLRGVRRAKFRGTTCSAPRVQCRADLVKGHFSAFRLNELWFADIAPQAGGAPSYVRAFSGWVYVNRPGFDAGSDDTEGSLSWDRRSIPMSCASEPRG